MEIIDDTIRPAKPGNKRDKAMLLNFDMSLIFIHALLFITAMAGYSNAPKRLLQSTRQIRALRLSEMCPEQNERCNSLQFEGSTRALRMRTVERHCGGFSQPLDEVTDYDDDDDPLLLDNDFADEQELRAACSGS